MWLAAPVQWWSTAGSYRAPGPKQIKNCIVHNKKKYRKFAVS
jgi:hypothetical protein